MDKVISIQQLLLRSRRLPWLVIGLALAVLAGVIGSTALQVRNGIRGQIAGRDGEVLHAVVMAQFAEDAAEGVADSLNDPGVQLTVMLKASQLKGVLGIRLFSSSGEFVQAFPPDLREGQLDAAKLAELRLLKPTSRFDPASSLESLFYSNPDRLASHDAVAPLLEVNLALHEDGRPLAGVAQFLIEGQSLAAEFARLDRHLIRQALTAFAVSGGLLALALAWAFRRLDKAHRLITERTENLLKANQELALAAKMTALGAVTVHLIHGLKNPLAGLQNFVTAHSSGTAAAAADWEQAVASTRRMQTLINQVVTVLHEEQTSTQYEVTIEELVEMVTSSVLQMSRETGASFSVSVEADGVFPNRVAHLVAFILANLAQNGLQATPRGGNVHLRISRTAGHLLFEMRDQGGGFPKGQPLFMPCCSTKNGGSGLGLALSKQLANHLGADLDLSNDTPHGCLFALRLPDVVRVAGADRDTITLAG
jgi:signal transduction histidine kinase